VLTRGNRWLSSPTTQLRCTPTSRRRCQSTQCWCS
jgi:hypothetical protein